ncbi:MAG: nicotinate-nucleotide adenylyltransferase [Proteobacteria bacterium]|nr:nicotinate-nucleotide adenylyltransferase [Pseudomonadota bacterium]
MSLIGILGGTFDPIHYGHIRLALEAVEQLDLDQVRLIPLNIPPHRHNPVASAVDRQNMLELAVRNETSLYIDLRELESEEVSYTIDTLKSLRNEFRNDVLFLIVGRDAFNKIDCWKDWQHLLDYAHIIVANRPGESSQDITNKINDWLTENQIKNIDCLKNKRNGYIHFIDIPDLDISSTMIRKACSKKENIKNLLPDKTILYIKENQLYVDTA